MLTASNAASDIDRLLSACAREQQPVHFAVPLDVQTAVAHTAATAVTAATAGAAASAPSPAAAAAARAVASALASAARPVLLAGPWARLPRAPLAWGPAAPPPPPLQALAETANLPLAVLPSARGAGCW